ncbi:MAG: protein kinase, partial [Thermoanaerobaculia bacterium]
ADRPRTQPGEAGLDKLVSDTLSGLERSTRKPGGTSPGIAVRPAAPPPSVIPPPAAPAAAPKPAAAVPSEPKPASAAASAGAVAVETPLPDRVPVSQPILTPEKEGEVAGATGNFGQYELAEKIATGGMAEVWKARMLGVEGFQKIVAIKKILPHLSDNRDFIEMFVDEAKLAAQLNHNNITHIYDLGKLQNSYYIAMEYIDGYDLKTILHRAHDRGEPMSVELALFIASKVAAALDYAHRKRDFEDREMGIVHRDVSPQNVLISQEGDIKLCDFGIAKAASKASHTQAGALKGKLQYMSPEQAWGRPIDRRSDVFALGSVLFEMLTGTKLFSGESEMSVLDQVREAVVRKPSEVNDEVPPEVDALLMSALAKDPAERYQSAGEMARDIDAILYSFKPTPTSADLAIYLDRLWAPMAEPAPMSQAVPSFADAPRAFSDVMTSSSPVIVGTPAAIVTAPVVARMPEPVAPVAAASPFRETEPEKKKSPLVFAGIAAGVLAVAIGAAVVFMGGKDEPAVSSSTPVAQSTSAAVLPTTATIPATASTTAADTVAPATGTAIDPTMVDREVQRRLAAERTRLEQQNRPQTATSAPEPAARAAAPAE